MALGAQPRPPTTTCTPIGRPQLLPQAPEASGIAQAGGALWTHNDSGAPVLFRLDGTRRSTAVTVTGAGVGDWEDLATGACTTGTCLYIADIGDNRAVRERITIYKVPLPESGATSTKPAEAFHGSYPDGSHDAEALLMTKRAGTFVITKEAPPRIYHFATSLKPGETGRLKFIRALAERVRITGAAASPDERWIALRSNVILLLYTIEDFLKGGHPMRVDLAGINEPQGEGVAFGRAGELYLVSEGGGRNAAGLLSRVRCAFLE